MGQRPPRRYWLTGAANGIGAALAEVILQTGAHLAVSARSAQTCEALAVRYPGQVLAVPGHLTDSQTVRELGELIARQWGALDTVILNAGSAEYVDGQPGDQGIIEHIVRSNLLAASFCISTALPLLRNGNGPHLVGIASPVTDLAPSRTDAADGGIRQLFTSVRADLAPEGIDVTLVTAGQDHLMHQTQWTADEAAAHVMNHLSERPQDLVLPALSMATLWPLPSSAEAMQPDIDPDQATDWSPIKGRR